MTEIGPDTRSSAITTFAMLAIGVSGFCMVLAGPGFVGLLVSSAGLSPSAAAFVTTMEMIGSTAAIAVLAPLLDRTNWRRLVLGSIALAIICDLLTPYVPGYAGLLAIRLVAGAGEGAVVATMVAAAGSSPVPGRVFGLLTVINLIVVGTLLGSMPWITAHGGLTLFLRIVAGISACSMIFLPWFPARSLAGKEPVAATGPVHAGESMKLIGIGGLAATFLLYTALGAVWPLLTQNGLQRGLSANTVASALAWASILGIAAGVTAAWLSARVRRLTGLITGSSLLIATMLALALIPGGTYFSVLVSLFSFFWLATVPFYMSQLAALDRSGRLVAFSMALQFAGFAAGPAIAGVFIAASGFPAAAVAAAAICTLGVVSIVLADRALGRIDVRDPRSAALG